MVYDLPRMLQVGSLPNVKNLVLLLALHPSSQTRGHFSENRLILPLARIVRLSFVDTINV